MLSELMVWFDGIMGSIKNPDDEISDIMSDFTRINNRLEAVKQKHAKADQKALEEIAVVKAEAERRLRELDEQHAVLQAAQERATNVAAKIKELVS